MNLRIWVFGFCAILALASRALVAGSAADGKTWPNYPGAATTPTHLEFADLPGFTRSTVKRNYALITPESRVFQKNPLLDSGVTSHLISPAMGANFAMYYARLQPKGRLTNPKDATIERFVICLDGGVDVEMRAKDEIALTGKTTRASIRVGEFGYMPANASHAIVSDASESTLLVFEREYTIRDVNPDYRFGAIDDQDVLPVAPEVFTLRKLMPDTPDYDFNIHVMDFRPGEHLHVKEVHYNQHGLLLVAGRGIYRLGDDWYPVTAGDVIWMAPYVPQWYAALGSETSRYILYKDTTVDPVLGRYELP